MSKLRVINQPLKVSGMDLSELDEQVQDNWDHKAESRVRSQEHSRRQSFKIEVGRG